MKLLLITSSALALGFLLGWRFEGLSSHAEAGVAPELNCSLQNGDVNADGGVDLSDAVTILGNLFLGNPSKLLPFCEGLGSPSGLPDTGVTICYLNGTVVPCDQATCPGQDGLMTTGCPAQGRFVFTTVDTVTDNCTGLMWQKDMADLFPDGKRDEFDYLPQCEALTYCDNLVFAGYDDWRLPNVRELQSIVSYGRSEPALEPAFSGFASEYLTSTGYTPDSATMWVVNFHDGSVVNHDSAHGHYVRAVRSAR